MVTATSTTSATPATAPAALTREHYRAARAVCRKHTPDALFAAQMLPMDRRAPLLVLAAVWRQLVEIMGPPQTPKRAAPDHERPPANCPPGECQRGGCDPGSCQGETVEQRRHVCAAVLDHLYDGQPTGKPELDAFAIVNAACPLPRELFDAALDAIADQRTRPRWPTWKRLRGSLDAGAGSVALLAARFLTAEPAAAWTDTFTNQVKAWAVGLAMIDSLGRIGDDWRAGQLMIPLDDLTRHGLSEADVARFTANADGAANSGDDPAAGSHDERFHALLDDQTQRIANLLRGGARALESLATMSCRRGAAVHASLAWRRLSAVRNGRVNPFADAAPPRVSAVSRFTCLPAAMRLAVDPANAAKVFR